jgi:hypothetical protein
MVVVAFNWEVIMNKNGLTVTISQRSFQSNEMAAVSKMNEFAQFLIKFWKKQ